RRRPAPAADRRHRGPRRRRRGAGPRRRRRGAAEGLMRDDELEQLRAEVASLRASQIELEAAASRLADAYHFAPVRLCTLDDGGAVRQINLTGAALMHRSRDEVLGRSLARLLGIDAGELRAHLQRSRDSGRRTITEFGLNFGDRARSLQLSSIAVRNGFA